MHLSTVIGTNKIPTKMKISIARKQSVWKFDFYLHFELEILYANPYSLDGNAEAPRNWIQWREWVGLVHKEIENRNQLKLIALYRYSSVGCQIFSSGIVQAAADFSKWNGITSAADRVR